jgi:hypothetical protein
MPIAPRSKQLQNAASTTTIVRWCRSPELSLSGIAAPPGCVEVQRDLASGELDGDRHVVVHRHGGDALGKPARDERVGLPPRGREGRERGSDRRAGVRYGVCSL